MQNHQQLEEISFFQLFYDVLFLPSKASAEIKALRNYDSTRLFFYAIAIIFLGALSVSAGFQDLNFLISSVLIWFGTVILIALLAWLFRPKEVDIDFGLLFFFCAFAQTPLIFLGLSKLWENSLFPTTGPAILCLFWSIVLWGWSFHHALDLGKLKAFFLLGFALLAPFLILLILIISVFFMFLTAFI